MPTNQTVSFRGARGKKVTQARNVRVMIYPASTDAQTNPELSARFRYGILWERATCAMDDGSDLQEGDTMSWSRFEGQDLTLQFVQWSQGAFEVLNAYFMPVVQGQG